ncbi:MAG: thiamine phosphate synthase [Pyrinomonadaceae bacterium]
MKKTNLPDKPLIYLITDSEAATENFAGKKTKILELVKAAVETKISLIQIREKNITVRMVFELASEAAQIAKNTDTKILINDRADIALAANADGVHLTSNSLSAQIVRRAFPVNFLIGVSAHTIEEAENAERRGANFITFSPIFRSPGKGEPHGISKLAEVCERLKPFPVLALGGIDETNFRKVLQAGASGFAAIRFLNSEENLRKLAAGFRR